MIREGPGVYLGGIWEGLGDMGGNRGWEGGGDLLKTCIFVHTETHFSNRAAQKGSPPRDPVLFWAGNHSPEKGGHAIRRSLKTCFCMRPIEFRPQREERRKRAAAHPPEEPSAAGRGGLPHLPRLHGQDCVNAKATCACPTESLPQCISSFFLVLHMWRKQIQKTQAGLQWIVAHRLLSALTIPGFS